MNLKNYFKQARIKKSIRFYYKKIIKFIKKDEDLVVTYFRLREDQKYKMSHNYNHSHTLDIKFEEEILVRISGGCWVSFNIKKEIVDFEILEDIEREIKKAYIGLEDLYEEKRKRIKKANNLKLEEIKVKNEIPRKLNNTKISRDYLHRKIIILNKKRGE